METELLGIYRIKSEGSGEDPILSVFQMPRAFRRVLTAALGALGTFMLFVAVPSQVVAQNAFAGIYFGTFSGANDSGQFGILVRTNGTAVITFYDGIDQLGGINENVGINPDGSFTKTNIDGKGTSVSGTFTATSVSGQFVASDGSFGNFTGSKISNIGFLRVAGGYYKGLVSGVVTANGVLQFSTSGTLFALVAANGAVFGFGFASGGGQSAETGGFFSVSSGGTVSGTLLDGTVISGNVNTTNFTANGTYSVAAVISGILGVHSGTWSMTRQLPLPNRVPVAVNDSYETLARRPLVVAADAGVLANDSDGDGDPLTAAVAANPANGTLALTADGGFTYTPDADFDGVDSFTYRASDGLADGNLATVTITVEPIKAMPWLLLLLLE